MKNRPFPFPMGSKDTGDRLGYARELSGLGDKLIAQNNIDEGLIFYQEAFLILIELLGFDHSEVYQLVQQMGESLKKQKMMQAARSFFASSLSAATTPVETANLSFLLERLGNWLFSQQDLENARSCYDLSIIGFERAYGHDDLQVLYTRQKLVGLLYQQGNLPGARAELERVLAMDERIFGENHPRFAADLSTLGRLMRESGDLNGAVICFTRAAAIYELGAEPAENTRLSESLAVLAEAQTELGDLHGAVATLQQMISADEKIYGPDHPKIAGDLHQKGVAYQKMGDPASARDCYRRALSIYERVLPPDHPNILETRKALQA